MSARSPYPTPSFFSNGSEDADDELESECDDLTSTTSLCATCDKLSLTDHDSISPGIADLESLLTSDESLGEYISCENNNKSRSNSTNANWDKQNVTSEMKSNFDSYDSDATKEETTASSSVEEDSLATSYCISDLQTIVGDSGANNSHICIKRSDIEWQKAVNDYLLSEMRGVFDGMALTESATAESSNFMSIA